MHEYGIHGWGIGWGWVIGVLVLAVLVWILVKAYSAKNSGKQEKKTALNLLKDRYARGEIDQQEFEQRKKDLQ